MGVEPSDNHGSAHDPAPAESCHGGCDKKRRQENEKRSTNPEEREDQGSAKGEGHDGNGKGGEEEHRQEIKDELRGKERLYIMLVGIRTLLY